jgi:hypothetical protein
VPQHLNQSKDKPDVDDVLHLVGDFLGHDDGFFTREMTGRKTKIKTGFKMIAKST